jgi:hypothetical protein
MAIKLRQAVRWYTRIKVVLKTGRTPTAAPAASSLRRSQRLLKAGALAPNFTAVTVKGGEGLDASAEQAETQASTIQNTQDFKSLPGSARKSDLGTRKASQAWCVPYSLLLRPLSSLIPLISLSRVNRFLSAAILKPSTGKGAREEPPEDDSPTPVNLSPPPSKKHRRDVSSSTVVQTQVASKTAKPLATAIAATPRNPRPRRATLPSRGRKHPPPATEDEVRASSYKRRSLVAPSTNGPPSSKPFVSWSGMSTRSRTFPGRSSSAREGGLAARSRAPTLAGSRNALSRAHS